MKKQKNTSDHSRRARRAEVALGASILLVFALTACAGASRTLSNETISHHGLDLQVVCGTDVTKLEPLTLDEPAPIDLQILSFAEETEETKARSRITHRRVRHKFAKTVGSSAKHAVAASSADVESTTVSNDSSRSQTPASGGNASEVPEGVEEFPTKDLPGAVARVDSVYFGENQSAILVPSPPLDALVALLETNSEGLIILEGHADATETSASALSRRRAEGARAYLLQRGVPSHRVKVRVHGTRSPSSIDTKEAGAQNRRVALLLQTERSAI